MSDAVLQYERLDEAREHLLSRLSRRATPSAPVSKQNV